MQNFSRTTNGAMQRRREISTRRDCVLDLRYHLHPLRVPEDGMNKSNAEQQGRRGTLGETLVSLKDLR